MRVNEKYFTPSLVSRQRLAVLPTGCSFPLTDLAALRKLPYSSRAVSVFLPPQLCLRGLRVMTVLCFPWRAMWRAALHVSAQGLLCLCPSLPLGAVMCPSAEFIGVSTVSGVEESLWSVDWPYVTDSAPLTLHASFKRRRLLSRIHLSDSNISPQRLSCPQWALREGQCCRITTDV